MRERLAYLHLPKAAGTSIRAALGAYYEPADTVPWSFDRSLFGDFARIAEVDRPVFLGDPADLRSYRFLQGHWSLPAILEAFDPEDVACVLREPRARFLSQYTYWRSWTDEEHAMWRPFDAALMARRPLSEYAASDAIAGISDNLATRLILGAHPLLPPGGPIAVSDVDAVATEACRRLDDLGFVDVVERGEETYLALEAWFGSPLSRERLNETQHDRGEPVDIDDLVDRRTLGLVNDRSAADLIVYHHVLAARAVPTPVSRSTADAAYAASVASIVVHHQRRSAPSAPAMSRTARLAALVRRGPRAWLDRLRVELYRRRPRSV